MENDLPHTPGVQSPVHIGSWLDGPQRQSGRFAEEINLLSLSKFEPRIIQLAPLSLYLLHLFVLSVLLFVLSVLVQGLLPPSDNSIAVSNNNNNNNNTLSQLTETVMCRT